MSKWYKKKEVKGRGRFRKNLQWLHKKTKRKFCYTCQRVTFWDYHRPTGHAVCNGCGRNKANK